jgi:hypothetical protein
LGFQIAEVVDLQQRDLVGLESAQAVFELGHAFFASTDAGQLGRQPGLADEILFGEQRAHPVFGHAVGGRGIDHACAGGEEPFQHFAQWIQFGGGIADLEAAGSAHADDRDLLPGGGDGAGIQGAGYRGRWCVGRGGTGGCPGASCLGIVAAGRQGQTGGGEGGRSQELASCVHGSLHDDR